MPTGPSESKSRPKIATQFIHHARLRINQHVIVTFLIKQAGVKGLAVWVQGLVR